MTDAELPLSLTRLAFHGPLSEARAARFVEEEWRAIRERLDQHRSFWLRGYYGILGQAYLTLVPVS